MLRALGGKLGEENQYGGKRGGFASYHKLKIVQRCVKIREGDAEINLKELRCFGKKSLSMLLAIRWFSQHQGRTRKSNLVDEVKDISASKIPSIMELQKLKD